MARKSPPPQSAMLPDQTVSHYEILRKLGAGGMGVVYLARDTNLGRLVALKFLPPGITGSAEQEARFQREARAISALNHPHIATIYGIEEADQVKFLVLEYLPGGSLSQQLQRRKINAEKLSARQALDWTIQIAEGLEHAHRHGIVHRDVKASNVLFTEEGSVKLADFGLARIALEAAADEGEKITESGHAIGTPPCMSPEQAAGQDADERSDIFSLGIVLFQLLTGEMPFRGAHPAAVLHEILYTPTPPLRQFRDDLPDALQPVVSRMLEKNPRERYQTVSDLLGVLRPLHAALESGASLPSVLTETATLSISVPRRRHARVMLVAAGIAAALLLALAVPGVRHRALDWLRLERIPAEKRIAVLLFNNIGGDPTNQVLADGLMEVVSNSLTRLEQFHGSLLVVPASDVRKEGVASAEDAWKKVGANLAITGSVQKIGNDIQVMINLVDTHTQAQLRTEAINTDSDLAAMQDRVVAKVARMLDLTLQPQTPPAPKTGRPPPAGASRFYIEGMGYLRRYDRPENIDNAIAAFKRALVIEPDYALAYAALAEAYWRRYEVLRDPQSIDAALANCSLALDLNDQLAPVHVTMGMVEAGKGQYELAEKQFKTALKLAPHNADAYRELATTYEMMGRLDLAEATYKRAIELRPDDWWSMKQLGVFYFNHGHYPEAERYFREVIQLTPDSAKAYSNLGATYLKMGRNADAAAQLERSVAIEPTAFGCSNLGVLYYAGGRYADAAAQYEKAIQLNPNDSRFWSNLADAYRWTPALAAKAPATFRRAIDLAEKESGVNPRDAQIRARIATSWASLGERAKAEQEIGRAVQMSPADGYVQFRAALVFEQAGQRDRALQALKSALENGYSLEEIRMAPPLGALREDPRFSRLVETLRPASQNRNPLH